MGRCWLGCLSSDSEKVSGSILTTAALTNKILLVNETVVSHSNDITCCALRGTLKLQVPDFVPEWATTTVSDSRRTLGQRT
ncbi:hypothetical protein EVAR_62889_1 [Eumeta japonica]|uniref:Uncharacterized protein n=1 Tax=Eumeta variegata TaxID=151549 RepID=A0A4C1ZX93_EUMVA|nr:hypothetical protein EVAR_62889_1 [Eumeta japonica]